MLNISNDKATKTPIYAVIPRPQKGYLVDVIVDTNFLSEKEKEKPVETQVPNARIDFVFSNKMQGTQERQLVQTHYGIQNFSNTKNEKIRFDIMTNQMKHIYEAYVGSFPGTGQVENFGELFTKIKELFDAIPDRPNIPMWLKIVYDYSNRVSFPSSPNFIEKVIEGVAPSLTLIEGKDNLKPKEKVAPINPLAMTSAPTDFPTFDEDAPF